LEAYIRLLEGALMAAWSAGGRDRARLRDAREEALDEADRKARAAWNVAGEVVLRLPTSCPPDPRMPVS
jgi:hypothetical protein